MKILSCIFVFLGLSSVTFAQKIWKSDSKYDANIKVYIVDSKYDADLLVYKVTSKYDASEDGRWFFVKSKYDADKKIYFTNSKYDADMTIFYVKSKYDSGWRDEDKKELLGFDNQ